MTVVYTTSDGGNGNKSATDLDNINELVPLLGEHVQVVNGEQAVELAMAAARSGKDDARTGQKSDDVATPLPGCSSGSCQCAYVHHPDRRDVNAYRRIANTLSSQLRQNNGEDRRQNRGRRKTDR